ncbi:MAG: PIG-L deacetylase family protein [Promethearchaeota archaeon]
MSTKEYKIMGIGAHPDDIEIVSGGLALLGTKLGYKFKFVSVTNGNVGHHKIKSDELAIVREKEAQAAASALGGEYKSLNVDDGYVFVNKEQTEKVVKVIREFDPDLVITHRPNSYHRDHRYTGVLVMDASYMLTVPQYCPNVPISPSRRTPVICYAYDDFLRPQFEPNIILDISDVYDEKAKGVAHHESQIMEWIPWTVRMEDQFKPPFTQDDKENAARLIETTYFSTALTRYRSLIKKGYPDKKVTNVEIYEICEYGKPASKKELKELFPGAFIPTRKQLKTFKES